MSAFAVALNQLKEGKFLARTSWPGITYVYFDGTTFFYSHLGYDSIWQPSHSDLLAEDWEEVVPTR